MIGDANIRNSGKGNEGVEKDITKNALSHSEGFKKEVLSQTGPDRIADTSKISDKSGNASDIDKEIAAIKAGIASTRELYATQILNVIAMADKLGPDAKALFAPTIDHYEKNNNAKDVVAFQAFDLQAKALKDPQAAQDLMKYLQQIG